MGTMLGLLKLFFMFAKIGLFTIGGGYAMLSLMQRDLVAGGLMTETEAFDMIAISQMTPGPFAVNAATFSGMRMYGVPGAIAATLGVIFPSLVITLLAAKFFLTFRQNKLVEGAMMAVRPVVLALIFFSALTVAQDAFGLKGWPSGLDWFTITLGAAALTTLQIAKRISPVVLILLCGLAGVVYEII